jgi:hypothetical protein
MNSSIFIEDVLPINLFHNLYDELFPFWTLDNQSYDNGKLTWGKNTNQENSLLILEASSIIRLKIMKFTKEKIKLCRVQVNGLTSNQICEMHSDYASNDYYTFVFFANEFWDLKWGGEFVCINPIENSIEYCPIIPNSGCLIPSSWQHYGKCPNPDVDELRITIGFSYRKY